MDQRMAIICAIDRTSPLLLHMEESLHAVCPKPVETLLLELPTDNGTRSIRSRLLMETADLLSEFMELGQEVEVVAISHRRSIHGNLVLRHHLVALFDRMGTLCWCHPAAAGYGLIRPGFPSRQHVRTLGRTRMKMTPEEIPRRLDEGTGLPAWFQYARESLRKQSPDDACEFADVIQVLGDLWVAHGLAGNVTQAMQMATQDYFQGFETFFGMGGLQPTPTILFH